MLILILLASLAIFLVSVSQGRWTWKRAVAAAVLVSVNAVVLTWLATISEHQWGASSPWSSPLRALILLELAAIGAVQCGVGLRRIMGYGLPATAMALVGVLTHDESLLGARIALVVFLVAMAVPFAVLAAPAEPIAKREILALALWFATIVSFASLGWRVFRYWLVGPMKLINTPDPLAFVPAEAFYLVPGMFLIGFLGVALAFCLLHAWSPRWITFPLVAFSFSLLAVMELTGVMLDWLPDPLRTVYLLAMTFGLELWVRRRPALVARSQLAFATPVLLCAVLAFGGWERDPIGPDERPPAGRPNVLVIVMDTARRASISVYHSDRPTTPELERWSRYGTVFTNAVVTSSWTLPSHASMFTGRWCHEHGATFLVPLNRRFPTLAESLEQRGYRTVGFVANSVSAGRHTGLGRGFQLYHDSPPPLTQVRAGSIFLTLLFGETDLRNPNAEEISDDFLDWMARRDDDRQFFAFLNYYDPHTPYRVEDKRFDVFTDWPEEEREHVRRQWLEGDPYTFFPTDERELQFAIDTYDASIRYMDWHIGRVLDRLHEDGILENTLVVITNDHGEHFGERGLFLHGTSLYRPLIDAPLIVLFPKHIAAPARADAVVGLQDLPATVFDVLGLPNSACFPGRSWRKSWEDAGPDGATSARVVLSQLGQAFNLAGQRNSQGVVYSLVADGLHYISYVGGHEELFDWHADPEEVNDLAPTPDGEFLLRPLRERLARMLAASASQAAVAY